MRIPLVLAAVALVATPAALPAASSERVETVAFKSAMLGAAKPYRVILPVDYATSPSTRYPVLYLLHGLSDNSGTWTERTNVVDSAAGHRFIVVMPEGDVSWYTDSATVPTERYESYLLEELIPDVQKRYRTIEEGYARGIAGLSMGGYGSLKMALKHPDEFALAASMSGSVNAARYTDQDAAGWELHARSIARAFGAADSPTRAANDLFALLRARAPGRPATFPYLYMDCGTEDALVVANRNFAALLTEKQLVHEFHEVPGIHNWDLWEKRIRVIFALADEKLPRR
jgi:S-formylglutathione hydrolase FrmB